MKKYSIGEVSSRLGLSRDTLRFYEKKGMIHPEKQKNGYRSYTYEDIRMLLSIMFYRRLNFSIEDINRILFKSSFHSYRSMIQEKIAEEKLQVEQHRQSLIHLKHLQQLYQNVEQCLNRYDIRPLQRYYQMTDDSLIDIMDISDLCYIYQEYRIEEQCVYQTDESFLLSADTAAIMKMEQALVHCPMIQHECCVYTVIASNSPIPEQQAILNAADWAKNKGYSLLGVAYSGYLLSCLFHEKPKENQEEDGAGPAHYIELYLPVHAKRCDN
ncbi:MerR family transcriptional regulator [Clostridium sp. Marseille-P2415]|uniref:MerR family transcriptional regulator n=1 Tax=Clostridium sp. Marseille-P2415 TaxID=1805471 RepID=UPI0009884BBD|nr:MerR family transcriptional regulator [Clostridium sp. Marseille-P2415]